MNASLKAESEKLRRSWTQHEPGWLRDYLVAGVEDPRVNLQSILSRHFLLTVMGGAALGPLMEEEYRFSAAMNWLTELLRRCGGREELELALFGLRQGADNVEGLQIPGWVRHIFASLPRTVAGVRVPNYVEDFLQETTWSGGEAQSRQGSLNTFCEVWRRALPSLRAGGFKAGADTAGMPGGARVSVLEPACGSANDYRFFESYGLAALIDYAGFDLCPRNIENARTLFPTVNFQTGNVFELAAADQAFDYTVVHDLFEHLSMEGLKAAVRELCRVTRQGLCVGFFQMDEIAEHVVRPVEEYHWNLLSMCRTRELFAEEGFKAQVLHIGTLLREKTGCDGYHNPNAYTFLLQRAGGVIQAANGAGPGGR